MKIAVLTAPRQFVIEDHAVPVPDPTEVLIRVETCGICTGELHVWHEPQPASAYPRSIGHEIAGIIEAVGSGVTEFKEGDRVAAINGHSGFAQYCKVNAGYVARIPDSMGTAYALGEPIACAVNAARRIRADFQDTIVLVGCGFMGLLLLQCLKAQGPKKIIAIDLRQEALSQALKYGADAVLPAGDELLQSKLLEMCGGKDPDIVIEATGSQNGLTLCGNLVKIRGRIVIYGYHQGQPRLVNMQQWNWKGLDVTNAHERDPLVYSAGMKMGFDLVAKGSLVMDELVTHRFSIEEINKAFQLSCDKPPGYIKSTIDL
ncbi:MAG: Alcohol dehydrogenase zinc-binding domain protein [Paenibacillus sp.]|jgi:threonine dehydrogenase-like Zn-dependent dehydrogenase|nr:Alcohol dehydrogenase zinc-binding domain protein [Paenibacillus sp.]